MAAEHAAGAAPRSGTERGRTEREADGRAGRGGRSGRGTARELLARALGGIRLSGRDSQFVIRLAQWDKRSAASVAALMTRARQAGREEAGLTGRQRELVVAALHDAAAYRASGADGTGCWDCGNIPGGRCSFHARDNDRARAYAELAATLSGGGPLAGAKPGLPPLADIAGYRDRTPVAS
jgi:hypothetical protein